MTDQEENEKEAFRTLINEIAMKNNSAHSYSEGSEPIKLTDEQRIKKEADEWFEKLPWMASYKIPLVKEAYIAGANAERELIKHQLEYTDEYTQVLTEHRDKLADKLSALEMADNIILKDLRDQLKQRDETIQQLKEVTERQEKKFEAYSALIIGKQEVINHKSKIMKDQHAKINQLKEALREVLDYWESHEPPTYHNTAYYNARKLLS